MAKELVQEFTRCIIHPNGRDVPEGCKYIINYKDPESGEVRLSKVFNFAVGTVDTYDYVQDKKWREKFKDAADKDSIRKAYEIFYPKHYEWQMPGKIAALKLD